MQHLCVDLPKLRSEATAILFLTRTVQKYDTLTFRPCG